MGFLVLKGHATRGKEVINLLEMLGANRLGYKDTFVGFYYYIECGAICSSDEYPTYSTIFTLEEFEEKYPYKVGDKVEFKSIGDANLKSKIIYMEWCNSLNKVLYTTEDVQVISTEDIIETKSIPSYKEEIMEENVCKKNISGIDDDAIFRFNYSMRPEVNADGMLCYKIPEGYETFSVQNGMIILKPKKPPYPKTYAECCQVLMGKTDFQDFELVLTRYTITRSEENSISLCPPHISLINNFYKLLICRDAYWKIASEQMGLDKPWKYDMSKNEFSCAISYEYGSIQKCEVRYKNHFLVFPTKETRDEFYKNFKELIEQCKELL